MKALLEQPILSPTAADLIFSFFYMYIFNTCKIVSTEINDLIWFDLRVKMNHGVIKANV